MSPTATAEALSCPRCGAGMKPRHGPRGPFLGCETYPVCRGSRSIQADMTADATPPPRSSGGNRPTPPPAAPEAAPAEAPGPADALIADLRKAGGHIGAALAILQRRAPETDQLLAGETIENVVPF